MSNDTRHCYHIVTHMYHRFFTCRPSTREENSLYELVFFILLPRYRVHLEVRISSYEYCAKDHTLTTCRPFGSRNIRDRYSRRS